MTLAEKTAECIPTLARAVKRTRWTDPNLGAEAGRTIESREAKLAHARAERMEMTTDELAPLLSSLCTNGMHAPCIDVDLAHRLRSRPGQLHVEKLALGWTRLTFVDVVTSREDFAILRDLVISYGWSVAGADSPDAFTLTLSCPARVVQSSNPLNRHLYIDAHLTWGEYRQFLEVLQGCGITLGNWVPWCLERGQSMTLRPGLHKAALRGEFEAKAAAGR